jgi:CHAD domain-containing protein
MAYCFAMGDASVEEGFRRIATELFRKVISQIDKVQASPDAQTQETIHQLRKQCKKLRGLYRLVRPVFPDYRHENAAVRDAARKLSPARDAEVLVETFDMLMTPDGPVLDGVAKVRRRLVGRCEELARGRNAGEAFAEFREAMSAARKRARRWELEINGFDALSGGLEHSLRRARKAMREAHRNSSPEAFHEWRKRAKDHWYHARLLSPIWPELLDPHVKMAEELGELLGLHHDLSVFRQAIASGQEGEDAVSVLDALAAQREAETAARSFALGARLLAEEPTALGKRWRAYWKCWRAEQQAPVPEPFG